MINFITSYNEYGNYCVPVDSKDKPAARKILKHEVYEPKTIEFMINNCGDGDIIHAGAYFGDFLPALSKAIHEKAFVWAFEPNKINHFCAKKTMDLNYIENVNLFFGALGTYDDFMQRPFLQILDDKGSSLGGMSRVVNDSNYCQKFDKPSFYVIDGMPIIHHNVSIIQLDVEGYEKNVLMGAIETINKHKPIIILEEWPDSVLLKDEWFNENILSLGYKNCGNIHENVVFSTEGCRFE